MSPFAISSMSLAIESADCALLMAISKPAFCASSLFRSFCAASRRAVSLVIRSLLISYLVSLLFASARCFFIISRYAGYSGSLYERADFAKNFFRQSALQVLLFILPDVLDPLARFRFRRLYGAALFRSFIVGSDSRGLGLFNLSIQASG